MKWTQPVDLHFAPRPKKSPRQSRSRHVVSAIRAACLQIIEGEGIDALTTNRIAEVAGVGIASVYQYFPNKDAILSTVFDDLIRRERELVDRLYPVLDGLSSREMLEYVIEYGIRLRRRLFELAPDFYRKYHREFEVSGKFLDPAAAGLYDDQALAVTRSLFARIGDDLRVPNTVATQFLFMRGIGAVIDKAAEDNPELLYSTEFEHLLKDMATQFFLKPQR